MVARKGVGAWCVAVALAGCVGGEAAHEAGGPQGAHQQAVVYGEDSRQDYHEAEARWQQRVRESVVALVSPGASRLTVTPLTPSTTSVARDASPTAQAVEVA